MYMNYLMVASVVTVVDNSSKVMSAQQQKKSLEKSKCLLRYICLLRKIQEEVTPKAKGMLLTGSYLFQKES